MGSERVEHRPAAIVAADVVLLAALCTTKRPHMPNWRRCSRIVSCLPSRNVRAYGKPVITLMISFIIAGVFWLIHHRRLTLAPESSARLDECVIFRRTDRLEVISPPSARRVHAAQLAFDDGEGHKRDLLEIDLLSHFFPQRRFSRSAISGWVIARFSSSIDVSIRPRT